jgi:hypothetical protein
MTADQAIRAVTTHVLCQGAEAFPLKRIRLGFSEASVMRSKYVPATVIARQYTSAGQNWPLSAVFGNAVAVEAKSLAAAAALNRNKFASE